MRKVISVTLFALVVTSCTFAADDLASVRKLLESGHYKRARAAIANVPTKSGTEYLVLSAKIRLAFGDLEEANKLAEQAVAADEKSSEAHTVLAKTIGQKALKANFLSQMGLARSSKKEVDRALELDPKNTEANNFLIDYLTNAPGIVGGDKNKAREVANAILKYDPVEGNLSLARVAFKDKQPAEAMKHYKTAVQAGPKNYRARASLANAYVSIDPKDHAASEIEAKEATKLGPDRQGGYALLALIYATQKRWNDLDAAVAAGEKAVPDNLVPYFQAAQTCLNEGSDLPRAERYFRKYLSQEPEATMPSLAVAHWRLGLALEKQGKKPEAIAELETAVKMNPELEGARKDLKRLQ